MRTASVNQAPAVPYHTPIRAVFQPRVLFLFRGTRDILPTDPVGGVEVVELHFSQHRSPSHARRNSSAANPARRRRTPRPPPSNHQQTFQLQPSLTIISNARYVTYRNMCSAPRPQPSILHQQTCLRPFAKTGQVCIYTSTYQRCRQARLLEYVIT